MTPGVDGRKMSKSYGNAIYLGDDGDTVAKNVQAAFTTETKIRKTDPGIPETCAVCLLRRLYDPTGYQTSWEEDRAGERGCVQNKRELVEILNAKLGPIRQRRAELLSDPAELHRILADGAERARATASDTMKVVRMATVEGLDGKRVRRDRTRAGIPCLSTAASAVAVSESVRESIEWLALSSVA